MSTAPVATASVLRRLRARGDLTIEADDRGISVRWWPKGQRGNPFCGYGTNGENLDALLVDVERKTRPLSRSFDGARDYRRLHEELRREQDERRRQRERDSVLEAARLIARHHTWGWSPTEEQVEYAARGLLGNKDYRYKVYRDVSRKAREAGVRELSDALWNALNTIDRTHLSLDQVLAP